MSIQPTLSSLNPWMYIYIYRLTYIYECTSFIIVVLIILYSNGGTPMSIILTWFNFLYARHPSITITPLSHLCTYKSVKDINIKESKQQLKNTIINHWIKWNLCAMFEKQSYRMSTTRTSAAQTCQLIHLLRFNAASCILENRVSSFNFVHRHSFVKCLHFVI